MYKKDFIIDVDFIRNQSLEINLGQLGGYVGIS